MSLASFNGGVIGPPNIPTSRSGSGVWTPGLIYNQLSGPQYDLFYPPPVGDPSFSSVVGLWHFTYAYCSTEDEILNRSSAGATNVMIRGGGAGQLISDSQKKWHRGSADFSPSSVSYYEGMSNADSNFGTGDYTVEGWTYCTSSAAVGIFVDMRNGTSNSTRVLLYFNGSAQVVFELDDAPRITSAASTVVLNQWKHVALSRVSSVTRAYYDGNQVGSNYADANTYTQGACRVGNNNPVNNFFRGYIDSVRITKGVGRYSGSTYTVPVAPFQDF